MWVLTVVSLMYSSRAISGLESPRGSAETHELPVGQLVQASWRRGPRHVVNCAITRLGDRRQQRIAGCNDADGGEELFGGRP